MRRNNTNHPYQLINTIQNTHKANGWLSEDEDRPATENWIRSVYPTHPLSSNVFFDKVSLDVDHKSKGV